ncbi:MAG TPA: hypothetical protein V6C65_12050 [Allocoleopsis sp.]
MATLRIDALDAAWEDGLLPKRYTRNQKLYIFSSIQTCNSIYWKIRADENGCSVEQLAKLSGLNGNTIKQFTRWLESKKLIYSETSGSKSRKIYFVDSKHPLIKTRSPI